MAARHGTSTRRRGGAASEPSGRRAEQYELPLRVTLVRPPARVQFCLQGRDARELFQQVISTGDDLSFDFAIRVAPGGSGPPRFLGPYTHGPPSVRFVYLCVGTLAGQADSCWTRRVKVPLSGITQDLIERARRSTDGLLQGRVWGIAKDGGPVCASVPLMADGWRLIE